MAKDSLEQFFDGKTVLITGGTGFLGKNLVEELLGYDVKSVRVFSRDELKHHLLMEKFKNNKKIRSLVGDVRDFERIKRATNGCDIVIHAAAMKRIDLIEYNVIEAIKTNVMGSINVVNACLENDVEKAVFVSTDKACSPINTYGATKMIGERLFIESNYSKGKSRTGFISVRYGNVLESTGSVIPFFAEKIKNRETIPLTDKGMTRFIITPKQAVELIFFALKHGVGGEIFVPKLKSLRIVDLIDVLQQHYNGKSSVKETGLRPGEKIHEQLLSEDECTRAFEFKNHYIVLSQIEKYHPQTKYPYLSKAREIDLFDYSSKNNLIEKSEIARVLAENSILK